MNGFLLNQIRKFGPFSTDELWSEIQQVFRPLLKIEGLPETRKGLGDELELMRIDKLLEEVDGAWKAVPQVWVPQEVQGSLF